MVPILTILLAICPLPKTPAMSHHSTPVVLCASKQLQRKLIRNRSFLLSATR